MKAITGMVMIGLGVMMVLLGRPRDGQDTRPFLQGYLTRVIYISIILMLLTFGSSALLV